jgi:DNA replication protein DnaC
LACAILHAILPQSEGIYTRATDIIQYVRSTWGGKSDRTSFDAIRLFSEVSLLVIDEVGVQAGTENEKQILFSIIDSRISENRPTIFLSNLRPADLNNVLGPRLVDRIRGKCVAYQFLGNSMRRPLSADVFGEAA